MIFKKNSVKLLEKICLSKPYGSDSLTANAKQLTLGHRAGARISEKSHNVTPKALNY